MSRVYLLAGSLLALLCACDRTPTASHDVTRVASRMYPVATAVAGSHLAGVVDTSSVAEHAALKTIAQRFRPNDQDAFMAFLSQPGHRITRAESPEFAQMLARYYAIRDARDSVARLLSSQEAAQYTSVPLMLAQATHPLEKDAKAYVIRRNTGNVRNIILLSPDADEMALGGAIVALVKSRRDHGDALESNERTVVSNASVTNLGSMSRARLTADLRAVASAPLVPVQGLGSVRAVMRTTGPSRK